MFSKTIIKLSTRALEALAFVILAAAALSMDWDRFASQAAAYGPASCVASPAGMANWWPGDGNANDLQGSNNGTLQNGATFAAGKVGQAFSFDGVDDFASCGTSAANFGIGDFTIDFWIKTTSARSEGLFGKLPVCYHDSYWFMDLANGKLTLAVDQDVNGTNLATLASNTPINEGIFHHVTATRRGNLLSIYIDGVLETTRTTAGIANILNSAALIAGRTACIGNLTQSLASFITRPK